MLFRSLFVLHHKGGTSGPSHKLSQVLYDYLMYYLFPLYSEIFSFQFLYYKIFVSEEILNVEEISMKDEAFLDETLNLGFTKPQQVSQADGYE